MALAVSLLGTVLGSQPAAGGDPIQSAVMESKVTVHSCKITLANCLSKRQAHIHTETHRSLTLPAAGVYPDNKERTRVWGCAWVCAFVLVCPREIESANREEEVFYASGPTRVHEWKVYSQT